MKVLLVHDYGSRGGGAELQVLALRRALRERGHHVRLLSSRVPLGGLPPEADATCFGSTTRLQVLSSTVNPSARAALAREMETFRPDVVHVRMCLWQLSPWILPLLRGTPAVYQAAVYKAVCPKGTKLLPDGSRCCVRPGWACRSNGCLTLTSWPPLLLQHRLWRRWSDVFDARVTLSEAAARVLRDGGAGDFEVIPNVVFPSPQRPPLTGAPLVGYAGRLSPEKGVGMLLRAFARARATVPDARLEIAGRGPEGESLRRAAADLGLGDAVELLGHLPRRDLERRFERIWVQAVPSLWEEPFGNTATEAQARGTAVFASRAGAFTETVEDGRGGRLLPVGEDVAWGNALAAALRDRDATDALGRAGRDRMIEDYGEDRWVESFLTLYRRHWR